MTSSTGSPPSCPPRWATPRTDRKTYGDAVAKVAKLLGLPLMPWQRQVVDTALEVDPQTGRLAYRQVVVTVPRQAGKTTLLLAVMTWRALAWSDQRIVYTAQTAQDARDKWRDEHVPLLERSPLNEAFTVRHSNGSEAIRWRNGSLQTIVATTEKAGHGKSIDLVVADEYFAHADNRLEQALQPAQITRPEPQFWIISTAGTANSVPLRQKVDRGRDAVRSGLTSGIAYFEWSADDDLDPSEPDTWASCHPAVGHTIQLDAIAADFATFELAEFERAYLNRWTQGVTSTPIPVSTWSRRQDDSVTLGDEVCFAVDMSPGRESASIAAAGPVGDLSAIELIDRRAGTDWVLGRCVQLWDRWNPIAIVVDSVGPAASLVPDLEAAGVRVVTSNSREMASACGRLFDAVINDKVRHRGQPDLTAAIAGSGKRTLGDAWAWSRSSSSVDISPLVAATLALWGAQTLQREATEASPVFAY